MEIIMKLFIMICLMVSFITNPMFSKEDIYFGVRISNMDSNKLRRIYKKYIVWNILLGIIATYIILKVQDPLLGVMGVVLGYIAIYAVIYLKSHKDVKALKNKGDTYVKSPHITIVDTNFTKEREKNMRVSPWYFLIPLAIILVTVIISFVYYDAIPNPMPMHYNAAGKVDRWVKKTYSSVFMLQWVSLGMTGMFYFIYLIIGKSKQQISVKRPKTSREQNRLYRKIWTAYIIGSATLMTVLFSYIQLNLFRNPVEKSGEMIYVSLGFTLLMLIATLWIGFYAGGGGNKLKVGHQVDEEWEVEEADDNRYWKWGSIYYNPNDPSVFIEKRVGIGWTVNMATRQGKLYVIGLIVFTGVIIIMSITIR